MISFYISSKALRLKRKGLSDVRVASLTKIEYGLAVHFLPQFIKSLMSTSDELVTHNHRMIC